MAMTSSKKRKPIKFIYPERFQVKFISILSRIRKILFQSKIKIGVKGISG